MSKRKIFRIVWFSLVGVFLIWNWTTFQSRNIPVGTFTNNDRVEVLETDDEIIFKSKDSGKNIQIIFFQGGLTDPEAYAPLCRKIAERGFTSHLIKMNFRLPQHDYLKISKMFDFTSGDYVIGGHSQGAKMAAQYVYEHPEKFKGLFLMGTSHPRDIDLSHHTIPTIKFYAENDGLASVPEVLENKDKLPTNAQLLLIRGGNHSQFGYLGTLLGDDDASISRDEQQASVLENLLPFINGLEMD